MNKLIIQEGKKYYGDEAAEETKETSRGDEKIDGGDKEFKEAHAEEIAFDRARASSNSLSPPSIFSSPRDVSLISSAASSP